MKSFFNRIFQLPVVIHLLGVVAVSVGVAYSLLKYIDYYTNHNQAVLVPDVSGLQVEEAIPVLEEHLLRYAVIDSIYSNEYTPGAIVKLAPEINSKVKKNRIIYITVNAKSAESAFIPDVADISFREVFGILKACGFRDVEIKYVPGDFLDLTIGVEYEGKLVDSGTRVPLMGKLILLVSDGHAIPLEEDTVIDEEPEEVSVDKNWF